MRGGKVKFQSPNPKFQIIFNYQTPIKTIFQKLNRYKEGT